MTCLPNCPLSVSESRIVPQCPHPFVSPEPWIPLSEPPMVARDVRRPEARPGWFPRPNMTMRELIGLVAAFALSNAFLNWLYPWAAHNAVTFGFWNGVLVIYLGYTFVQAWVRAIVRWLRTGNPEPRGGPRPWTALGVAEATVISGTLLATLMQLIAGGGVPRGGEDWFSPLAILVLGTGTGLLLLHRPRRDHEPSATAMQTLATIERAARITHEENS